MRTSMHRLGILFLAAGFMVGCENDENGNPIVPVETGPIVMTVEFPEVTLAGTSETLRIRAGHVEDGDTL